MSSKNVGEVYVFVDECHRTQSGKLHKVMKAMMPNAVFMGFTGTPLLKKDKQTSLEVFGGYIHTYKLSNLKTIAETIENNVRSKIIKEQLTDPAFYDRMSVLLDEVIAARNTKAIEYEKYLKRIAEIARQVQAGKGDDTPQALDTSGKRAIYNKLRQVALHEAAWTAQVDRHRRLRPQCCKARGRRRDGGEGGQAFRDQPGTVESIA